MWFLVLTASCTVLLMAWGAFVTSINAGLAVPDWPTTFDSYDMFNPWPQWWTVTPVLAEHGHRLLGALVGLLTIVVAIWTAVSDERRWMKWLGLGALVLVIFQGILGGLRVVLVSLDLAVFHACIAQVYFAIIVSMTLFTSKAWIVRSGAPTGPHAARLRGLVAFAATAVFIQIVFGALLRHPGTGIDSFLATTHIIWAFIVVGLILTTAFQVYNRFPDHPVLKKWTGIVLGLLALQIALGFTAFFVLLDERGIIVPSNLQVIINSTHMVTGALLMSSLICCAMLILRRRKHALPGISKNGTTADQAIPVTSNV